MMKRAIPILCAAVLAVTGVGAAVAPAQAAPVHQQQPTFQAQGNYAWYNGHRGYRHHYAGYRLYNGYWFPPAAFVVGSLVFGTILGAIMHH